MFTYRIAAALAIEGARIPSSNTDGIYVFDMPIDKNTKIVDRELKKLYISIDPEPLYLVSKDANNRMEMSNGKVTSARGGTLTSWSGARVDNRLSHPAIVDKVMTYYLQLTDLKGDVDQAKIKQALKQYYDNPVILDEFKDFPDAAKRTFVYMASWVMRSTSGSIFIDSNDKIYPGTIRVWLTKSGPSLKRYTTRKAKPSKSFTKFAEMLPKTSKIGDPDLLTYLIRVNALDKYFTRAATVDEYLKNIPDNISTYVVAKAKISGLPDKAHLLTNNNSLLKMSEKDIDDIYQQLDLSMYAEMISEFAKVWQNPMKKS